MPVVHPGATLTPHFRDFLPAWVARQPWFRGTGVPSLQMTGAFRFEDPAGEVGIETHLLTDGALLYQVPMTYRGAALAGSEPVAVAEHSVLGTRWIYDATADPVWTAELLRLVNTEGTSELSAMRKDSPAQARGLRRGSAELTPDTVVIELRRELISGGQPDEPGIAGLLMGWWPPPGGQPEDHVHVHGCLAVVRELARPEQ